MGGYDAVHDGWEILGFECKIMIVFNVHILLGHLGHACKVALHWTMEQAMFMYHTVS
jgi:hypothetical protein